MLLTFLICLKLFMLALSNYNESNLSHAINYLVAVGLIMAICEVIFLGIPFMLIGEL